MKFWKNIFYTNKKLPNWLHVRVLSVSYFPWHRKIIFHKNVNHDKNIFIKIKLKIFFLKKLKSLKRHFMFFDYFISINLRTQNSLSKGDVAQTENSNRINTSILTFSIFVRLKLFEIEVCNKNFCLSFFVFFCFFFRFVDVLNFCTLFGIFVLFILRFFKPKIIFVLKYYHYYFSFCFFY